MSKSDVDMCSSALLLAGADEITSFSDDTRESKICSALYRTTMNASLQSHYWNFSLKYAELAKTVLDTDSAEYKFGWLYSYQLPPDFLRMLQKEGSPTNYSIEGNKVFCNDEDFHILYQYQVDESLLPDYFVRAFEYEFAKVLSVALLRDADLADVWASMAADAWLKARTIDSQNTPPYTIDGSAFALTAVR